MEELDCEDTCSLCYDVFHYPVTLPCKHRFCKDCFDKHVEQNTFTCPLCRCRLSNWLRKLTRNKEKFVDVQFWEHIKQKYPKLVERRDSGDVSAQMSPVISNSGEVIGYVSKVTINNEKAKQKIEKIHAESENEVKLYVDEEWRGWPSPVLTDCRNILRIVTHLTANPMKRTTSNGLVPVQLAEPGEIRREYEELLRKEKEEHLKLDEKNMHLSVALIKLLEEDERKEIEARLRQHRHDEELAKGLAESGIGTFSDDTDNTDREKKRQRQLEEDEELARSLNEDVPENIASLRAPPRPKRKRGRRSKSVIDVKSSSRSETEDDVSTVTVDETGNTDASSSSPFKNSAEFNKLIYADPSPAYFRLCGNSNLNLEPTQNTHEPHAEDKDSRLPPSPLRASTPLECRPNIFPSFATSPIQPVKPSTSKAYNIAAYFTAGSSKQRSSHSSHKSSTASSSTSSRPSNGVGQKTPPSTSLSKKFATADPGPSTSAGFPITGVELKTPPSTSLSKNYAAADPGPSTSAGYPITESFQRRWSPHSSHINTSASGAGTSIPSYDVEKPKTPPIKFFSKELSNFAAVEPGPSTSADSPVPEPIEAAVVILSRSSSGADSISPELHHFKPIRASPTTPPKDGSGTWPQFVAAHRYAGQELRLDDRRIPDDMSDNDNDKPSQHLNDSVQIDEDRKLAIKMQKEWDAEEKRVLRMKPDYNLRKKKKGNLRKKVLLDRAQATLDSMLIK